MKNLNIFLSCFVLGLIGTAQTVQLNSFASGFSSPVEIAHAGDSRLFVVEKSGIIKILNSDGSVNPTPFLNISNLVGSGGERGLLGLAFAPDYVTSGRFYVNYTDKSSTDQPITIIARYTVSGNPDTANSSGESILTYQQPYSNHNGGKLAFANDGFLYIGVGDGGSGGDPQNRAQNTSSLFGKLLRIDVSGATYNIPSNNPFSSSANGPNDPRPEIYVIGLRNPWKFSFDSINNDLWIADVGQNAYEEINKVTGSGNPGDNYGWRCYEGTHTYNTSANCPAGGLSATVAPVAEYPHVGSGCSGSITGGYLYRGSSFPNFYGKYFFADYCTQNIGILTENGSNWNLTFQTPNITQGWTTLGEDFNGELYIAGGSSVYKISDANLDISENKEFSFKMYPNPTKDIVNLDLSGIQNKVNSITIYNIQGQTIFDIAPNQGKISIKTENYSKGLYFVEVRLDDSSKTIKKLTIN
ncbi:PQQ-dependent sugar dehydrogenase [Flavobacteriaceae bacterium SZ-1-7]|uniref:PQQ-dependent sugar dehydrogenase n=1 Tax=Tamlana sedimenti TaxID=3134126 RepID=UPI003123E0AF